MKTIEERAKQYSLKDFDGYYTGREKAVEEGYIAGATEQKAIDAEKLISAIERRIEETKSMKPSFDKFWAGQISAFKGVITIISSLQQEQKAIDEEVRLKKCDDMTEAEYSRETAFVDWYLKNGNGAPTFSDAIEWARKDLLDKACKWLKENARDYACATVRCPYGEEEEIICDVHLEIVEDFRKAMEE